ncbi:polysaccharide biosynthesis tyrosine autokinase [soil metagenome]
MTELPPNRRHLSAVPIEMDLQRTLPHEYEAYPAADSVDLREVFAVLRRNAGLIAGIAAIVTMATTFLVLRQPAEYRAGALIRLKDARGAMTAGIGDGAALQGLMMGRTTDPLLSELEVLKSRAVAKEVVDREGLRLAVRTRGFPLSLLQDVRIDAEAPADTFDAIFTADGITLQGRNVQASARYGETLTIGGGQFTIASAPDLKRAELVVVPRELAIEQFLKDLSAKPRAQTDVVDVQYRTTDPHVAQRVVNSAVDLFQSLNMRTAQVHSRRRRVFVEEQLQNSDSILARTQTALSNFRRRENVYSSREKFAAEQNTLMGLDVRREELDAERRMYESLLAGVHRPRREQRGDGLQALVSAPGIAANPVVTRLYTQLVQFEVSLDSLTVGAFASSPNNPDVQRLRTMVASTQTNLVEAARSHVESVRARIAALDDLKARATVGLQSLPDSEAEEVRLVIQVETVRKIADQLREEYQKARVAEVVEVGQVELVDAAPLPDRPVPSHRALKLALGLFVGLMLGSGGAFLREHANTSIGRREDMEKLLQVPTLGVIPRIRPVAAKAARFRLPLLGRGGRVAALASVGDELVTVTQARSAGAEAYRAVRTNLIFSQSVTQLKTLVVTSTAASEGKSTTSANLAVAFAQQGLRVLLIDCDLRKARLHKVFGVPREPGLTQLVLGHAPVADLLRSTPVEGLSFLSSGTLPPNPAELLGGAAMRNMLAALEAEFDLIILDTPPLLAASDAAILGTVADGVLVVIRAGHTERGAARQAVQQLAGVGARVVGAVLNDPDAKVEQYGGYYYYNYEDVA